MRSLHETRPLLPTPQLLESIVFQNFLVRKRRQTLAPSLIAISPPSKTSVNFSFAASDDVRLCSISNTEPVRKLRSRDSRLMTAGLPECHRISARREVESSSAIVALRSSAEFLGRKVLLLYGVRSDATCWSPKPKLVFTLRSFSCAVL